jgi:hypothetical protein
MSTAPGTLADQRQQPLRAALLQRREKSGGWMDGVGSSGVLISEKRWEWHGEKEMGARKANGMSTGDEGVLKTGRGRGLGLYQLQQTPSPYP